MQEYIVVTGIVLRQTSVGEYDRHILLLTKERGKISVFARGAKKPISKFAAATNTFSFGRFKLFEGKNSYTLADTEILNYFESFRTDYVGAYYGVYFAEIADYYTRENNDEIEMMKLLYQSLRALESTSIDNRLIRCIYECKVMIVNGEFPGIPSKLKLDASTIYALQYIMSSSIEKLYTFSVSETVLNELKMIAKEYCKEIIGHQFKSLEVLETLC